MSDPSREIGLDRLADYLEGRLDASSADEIRRELAASNASREELEWLEMTVADLEFIGDSILENAPDVDLVDAVMAGVEHADCPGAVVRIDEHRHAPRYYVPWRTLGLAVAATLLVVLGLAYQSGWLGNMGQTEPTTVAMPERHTGTDAVPAAPTDIAPRKMELADARGELDRKIPKGMFGPKSDAANFEATASPELTSVTLADVIQAKRDAREDETARAKLFRMASLTPEDVKEIIESSTASPQAVCVAASSLGDEDARQLLMTVVGKMPDNSYAHLSLAKACAAEDAQDVAQGDVPSQGDPALLYEQLGALRDTDPGNALFDYMEAREYLRSGDLVSGLAALKLAQEKQAASAYAREGALFREQALLAAGLDVDAARALSALTAGASEYDFLVDLGNDLLEQGRACLEQGDVESALAIYQATQQLGEQLGDGALFSQEALAALDIERAAIEAMEGAYTQIGSAAGIEALTLSTLQLVSRLDEIGELLNSFSRLVFGNNNADFWATLSAQILQNGDLAVAASQ